MLSLALPLLLLLPQAPPVEVGAGPEPARHPVSWELEFRFLDPKRIEVQLPGSSRPDAYWYMVYTVSNPSTRARRFFPMFQIVTDDLKVYDTDMGISPLVFDAIRDRHKIMYPYLVPPTKAYGTLLSGDDYARESVAIWRDIDLNSNGFVVYVTGLCGETRFVRNPGYDPDRPETETIETPAGPREVTANPKYFTLRKTLEIRYNLPGSPAARGAVVPERGHTRWIMR